LPAQSAPAGGPSAQGGERAIAEEIVEQVRAAISPEDAKGFQPLPVLAGPAATEYPQSLEQYKAALRVRPSPELRTLVLQPLGEFNREQARLLELLREYAALFFQLPARVEKPLPLEALGAQMYRILPLGRRHWTSDKQYNADRVIGDFLAPRRPGDALLSLGVTLADLYCGEGNYVFGVASAEKRVGVCSLCRFYPEFWGLPRAEGDATQALRRACKILNHETGHIFGLRHCLFYRCSMNYANSLQELDDTPLHYCPVCHRKLLLSIGFDPARRYAALKDFYARNGLAAEAEWLAARLRRWKTVAAQDELKKVKEE
jgi:archaemetzincin